MELKGTLRHLRVSLNESMRRMLIYDAARAARADGTFALQERKALEDAGELLGIDGNIVTSIVALVELEESAKAMRRGLLLL